MRSGRLGLSAIDKREIWSRWKAGQTLHEIGRAYGKCHNAIRAVLLPRGGIPPVARRRSRLALTFAEREDISRDGFRFIDSGDRQLPPSSWFHGESGNRALWWPTYLSRLSGLCIDHRQSLLRACKSTYNSHSAAFVPSAVG
jgi:hypothetical protein